MIAVVLGAWSRRQVVHGMAVMWLGPACNLGADPAHHLVPGQQVDAERVTCWACRNPQEARAGQAAWQKRRLKMRGAK